MMIWVSVSSQSCCCWLYRTLLSLAVKNIINLISVFTIWWCPCVELSLVLLEESVCYDMHSFDKTLLAFSLLHFSLQGQICLILQVSLDFLLFDSNPLWCEGHLFFFFGVSYRSCASTYFIELINFNFFSISGWGIDLDMFLNRNRNF